MGMFILLTVAIIPTLAVMWYVYKMDKIEKEPAKLLLKIFLFGVISTVPAMIVELAGDAVCTSLFEAGSLDYMVIYFLVIVAFGEELSKRFLIKKAVWNSPEFNYTFDAVVYCVVGSMGFACLENIFYVFQFGIGTGLVRAVTSIPGHAIFGVYMGLYFGKAKVAESVGDLAGYKDNYGKSILVPAALHGAYDFLVTLGENAGSYVTILAWFALVVIMDVRGVKAIKNASAHDEVIRSYSQINGFADESFAHFDGTDSNDDFDPTPEV